MLTGAFSLTLQAVQLGYSPRVTILHTSPQQIGQIYIPSINWALMFACIALVLGFHSSSNLAAAYGVSISIDMVITTLLFFVLVRDRWHWSLPFALLVCGTFLALDLSYFGANITKIDDGGWFPLLVGGAAFTLMSTWRRGRILLGERMRQRLVPLELFLAELLSNPPPRVPGIAAFMSGNPIGTPPALRHNVKHNKVLHETVLLLSIDTAEVPHVPAAERLEIEQVGEGFWRVIATYGFMDEPNVPELLGQVHHSELVINESEISYFLGRETLLATGKPGMALWRERLFTWMSRNAQTATAFFNLPPDRVIELGVQVEL
jgi:KUP system potassium uptake protein